MRRFFSILLLAVFVLPLLAPVLAMAQDGQAAVPACCRRNGRHHCGMSLRERRALVSRDPAFRAPTEKCPFETSSVAPARFDPVTEPPVAEAIFGHLVSHPTGVAQTESRRRIARDRSRQKRGPPALSL